MELKLTISELFRNMIGEYKSEWVLTLPTIIKQFNLLQSFSSLQNKGLLGRISKLLYNAVISPLATWQRAQCLSIKALYLQAGINRPSQSPTTYPCWSLGSSLVIEVLPGERLWGKMGKRFDSIWSLRTTKVSTPLKWNKGISGLMRPRAESSVDGSESFCGLSHHLFCWGGTRAHWGHSAHHCWIEDEARKSFHGCFLHRQTRENWKQGGGKSSATKNNIRQWGTFHSGSLPTSPPPFDNHLITNEIGNGRVD